MKKRNQFVIQNQRIERINVSTLVVGVDIAKLLHAGQATDYRGIVLSEKPLFFGNHLEGFEEFLRWVRQLQLEHGKDDVVVGMESTGHYWFNFADWLVKQGIEVMVVNPATTKRNKENRDNTPSKSDPKDALVIAECVSRGFYTQYHQPCEKFQNLRAHMANRERWVSESVRLKNQLHRWLDLYFPEFAEMFPDLDSLRSLATLREFPAPSDLNGLTPEDVVEAWGKHMQRPGGVSGLRRAKELLERAKRSAGETTTLKAAKWDLQHLLDRYEQIQKILGDYAEKAEDMLADMPGNEELKSVGLSATLRAAILAFGGDLRHFDHGDQLLRKAGLNLAERSSGKHKGKVKLSKRGSSRLRKYLFLATLQLVANQPAFQRWHEHNVKSKRMTKMKSIVKLMGKLARILVAIVVKGESFQAEKAQPNTLAAA